MGIDSLPLYLKDTNQQMFHIDLASALRLYDNEAYRFILTKMPCCWNFIKGCKATKIKIGVEVIRL